MDPTSSSNTQNSPLGNNHPVAPSPSMSSSGEENPLATPPSVPIGGVDNNPATNPVATQPSGVGQAVPLASAQPPHPQHKSRPMIWVIILLVFSFFCGLFLAAWYFQTQIQKLTPVEEQTTILPNTPPKNLVIGTDATFQPMEYVATEGALLGYDIDLGNRIGQELGAEVTFKNIAWEELFAAMERKEIDMIMSSVTITQDRKQLYDFSDNYLNAGQVVITQRTNNTITSAEGLQGKRIAVQEGTTNEEEALKLTSPNLVIRYSDFEQAIHALLDREVDAMLSDLPGAKGIVLKNPTLKIASDPFTNEYYGIVFRKGDPNVKFINDALSVLKTQGVLTDLKQKWLD